MYMMVCILIHDAVCCSKEAALHDLLLTVLWEGVVHASPLVRATAARMFDVSSQHVGALSN